MKSEVSNINWFEWLEKNKESLQSIKNELDHYITLMKWLISEEKASREINDLEIRAEILFERCIKIISKDFNPFYVDTEKILKRKDPQEKAEFYQSLEDKIASLNRAVAFLSHAIENRLKGSEIFQSSYFFPTQSSSYGFPDLHRASSCVLLEFFNLIYGHDWLNQADEPPPLVIFDYGGYRVYSDIRVAIVPISDRYRMRFWVGLGHEAFHEKITTLFNNLELAILEDKPAIKKLNTIFRGSKIDYEEILKLKIKLTEKIGVISSYNQRHDSEIIAFQIDKLISNQIQEIFCDIGSILLSGPADFLASCCLWAPRYKNPIYGFNIYFAEYAHPPEYVRLRIMLNVLKENRFPKNDIDLWSSRIEEITGYDTKDNPSAVDRYKGYIKIISENLDSIVSILHELIIETDYFDASDWEKANCDYSDLMTHGEIDNPINAIDVLNMAWLKRQEVFEKIGRKGNISLFGEWHKRERKLYEHALCYLTERYIQQICKKRSVKNA